MSTRVHPRPSGAMGCSHGWSDAARSIAQPVEPISLANPAPEGRRGSSAPANAHGLPKIPSPLPGRAAAPLHLHGFRSSLRDSLHPWLQPGVPSGRSMPSQGCTTTPPRAAAHILRPAPSLGPGSPGLRARSRRLPRAGAPVRGPAPGLRVCAPGLRSRAPLPSGPVGRPSDSAGRPSGSSVRSADSPGGSSGPAVASAGSSGRPASPSGRRDDSPGRRDRSSVASANSPVAWRRSAPEPPRPSFPWPSRGVAGGPPPASAHDPRPPKHTARPSRRPSF